MADDLIELQSDGLVDCPQCGGKAEPELDGEHAYYACSCGFEFGYTRVEGNRLEGNCQIGVPANVRKAFSDIGDGVPLTGTPVTLTRKT